MKRFLLAMIAMTLLFAMPSWAKTRSGLVTMEFDLSAQPAGEVVRLWVPYPVSNQDQLISNIRLQGDYAETAVYTVPANGTPLLYAEWPQGSKSRKLTLAFEVVRDELRRNDFPAREPAWNPADYAEYLAPTSIGPTDGAVKELADKIVAGKATVLERTRAIYDWTVENMYRDPETIGCGKGDVCYLLIKPGGKCTDISSVFVALCRAAGVPAREVFGLRLGKQAEQDITNWQHCWAEFFLPGYGWVPADPADVLKAMLVEKLELSSPRIAELRDYFWGGIDAYRFQLASGRDLVLNPVQAGEPLNTFGYPYAEVGGKPLNFYEPQNFIYRFSFNEL
ncbi:MAG: transglutaminase domain-containing protein [Desulfuromonadales bacterium]|nr:transglutaminase domain-containing protein [Desulfuromonadales bacterium]